MMRRDGFEAKEEGQETIYNTKISGKAPIISSSRQWSSTFKNPRIVRVSRAFGGKDRHSKVCTIRGLRDRRIRLSVPTAIQLYDLQDRLGLNQPSKVVDWLLEVTKHEIDKLPPLQIPPGSFNNPFDSNSLNSSSCQSFLNSFKEVTRMSFNLGDEQLIGKSSKESEKEIKVDQDGIGGYYPQVSAQNLFPTTTNFLNNGMPYNVNPYYHFEPSSLSLSQFGSHGLFPPQMESSSSGGHMAGSLPSSSSLPSVSPFFISPPEATPSTFPQYNPFNISATGVSDIRQFNNFLSYPFLSSSTSKEEPVKRNTGT